MTGIILSKCGFRCDRCPAYKENSATEAQRIQGARNWEKYFGLHFNPDIVKCEGCQSVKAWRTGNLLPDRNCIIRACAENNAVTTCANCVNFPCQEYVQKVPGPELREQREQAAKMKFSDSEYRQFLEPFDGKTHLRELHASLKEEEIKNPVPIATKVKIAPFSSTLSRPAVEQAELKHLYELLKAVYSEITATYAGQVLLERRRPYLRGILWVMGLYGELEEGKLVVESVVSGKEKECSRLVRKGDNSLHKAVVEAAQKLAEYGLVLTFTPSGREWCLTLKQDNDKLGHKLLPTLKNYVTALVREYGKPVYVDSYNLKGKAFKSFTALDMSLF